MQKSLYTTIAPQRGPRVTVETVYGAGVAQLIRALKLWFLVRCPC